MTSEVWDERYRHATRASDVLVVLAQDSLDLDLDDATKKRWAELFMLMREVDTKADTTPPDEILRALEEFTLFHERYPTLAAEGKESDMHTALLEQTSAILRAGEHMSNAKTPLRYQAFRRREAVLTAKVFSLTASSEVKTQERFEQEFEPLLARLAVAASYFDTVVDARRDFEDGIIQFELPAAFKLRLLMNTVQEMAHDAKYFLKPTVAKAYGKMCIKAVYSHHKLEKTRRAK